MKENKFGDYRLDFLYVAMVTLVLGVVIYTEYNRTISEEFNNNGQYAPKYMIYNHDQMLFECEKHNLIYNHDDGECMTQAEWEHYERGGNE